MASDKTDRLTRAERRVIMTAMLRARRWRTYKRRLSEDYDEGEVALAYQAHQRARDREDAACAALEAERKRGKR